MIIQANYAAKPLTAAFAIVLVGISVGVAATLGINIIRPAVLAFVFGGFLLLLPTLMVREPLAYWQFLFVLSFLVAVSKRLTTWLVEPPDLFYEFGFPASGTLSIDIYVSDAIMFVMLVPWIAQLSQRRASLYFPSMAYLFVLYLAWTLGVALLRSKSLYLSMFEWCRELIYFLSFIYIINNVVRRLHIRAIVLALMVGLVVASISVIGSFVFRVTPGNVFEGVYQERTQSLNLGKKQTEPTSQESGPYQRASGIFVHPADATYYFEYILPVVLGYLVTSRGMRDRLLFGGLFGLTCVATYLTFSRAGLIGLFAGVLGFFSLAGWSGLISRRALARWLFLIGALVAVSMPLLIYSVWTRPESINKRMELNMKALATVWQRPIFGGGLNNSSAVMEGSHNISTTSQGSEIKIQVVHNYYLNVLIEVGIGGFLLFFTFFGQAVVVAVRHLRAAELELKILLVGIASGLASVAVQNLGDPFGAHQGVAMWWLYTGLAIAICRRVRVELPARAHGAAGTPALAPGPAARPND